MKNNIKQAHEELKNKLHHGAGGYTCSCGQCKHQINYVARKYKINKQLLENSLDSLRKNTKPVEKLKIRQPLKSTIAENALVSEKGKHYTSTEGLLAVVKKLKNP